MGVPRYAYSYEWGNHSVPSRYLLNARIVLAIVDAGAVDRGYTRPFLLLIVRGWLRMHFAPSIENRPISRFHGVLAFHLERWGGFIGLPAAFIRRCGPVGLRQGGPAVTAQAILGYWRETLPPEPVSWKSYYYWGSWRKVQIHSSHHRRSMNK